MKRCGRRCHRFGHPRAQTTPHHSIIHAPKMIVYLAPNKFQFSKGKGESELLRSDCLPPPHLGDTFGHPLAQTTPRHSIIHTPQIPVHHPALVKFQFSKGSPPPTHRLRTPTTPTITHIHNTPRTVRRPLVHLGVHVSDNIRCDVIIPIF